MDHYGDTAIMVLVDGGDTLVTDGTIDTSEFFSGGAGMFIQYHDIIKPVYLYSIFRMIISGETYGLPVNIIKDMSILSLIEWYKGRRYKNPILQLDWQHLIDEESADMVLRNILSDNGVYKLSPLLTIEHMLAVYRKQHLTFPIFIYSETEEPGIRESCKDVFDGINYRYVYGPLNESILQCDQNFTYIFSDIELVKKAAVILKGSYSHILLARDYRYNYIDNFKTFKYDLMELMINNPFVRIGTTIALDVSLLEEGAFENISNMDEFDYDGDGEIDEIFEDFIEEYDDEEENDEEEE